MPFGLALCGVLWLHLMPLHVRVLDVQDVKEWACVSVDFIRVLKCLRVLNEFFTILQLQLFVVIKEPDVSDCLWCLGHHSCEA